MLTYGFGSFFNLLPGGDVSSLLLIYGFVISLLGFALAYAQLVPVPCKTTKSAFDLRETQATDIQKQVGHRSKENHIVRKVTQGSSSQERSSVHGATAALQ